ncbi:MAG: hypothetical protein IJQ81_09660 [Oscillibacter sp.]|nr:hypothetical protein [Oscillibacter sp.]
MSRVKTCCDCGKRLKKDEIALTRKLVDMDAEEFYCMDCLSEFIGCSVQDLKEKIQEFKEQGCTLFL